MALSPLPIDAVLSELVAHWRSAGAAVLKAPTGAGKTTRVPPALAVATPGRILVVEPRRVAARAAARRMAHEHGSALGDRFGYSVRFDKQYRSHTRVVALTPGILLRMLQDDPFLESIAGIIFDEFHERGLEADLALGSVKLLRETVRPDLRVLVMSATLEGGPISAYLGECPIVTSEGRSFPVEIRYRPRRSETSPVAAAGSAVHELLNETPGDLLVFLPGLREIRQLAEDLDSLQHRGISVLPLHGDLPPEEQDNALRKWESRKIVLSTNVAETSITVEGVTAVIDTGLARQMEFDTSVGLDRLRQVPISKASADQRAGRAGRTQPGLCVRLWDEPGHRSRPEHTEPEIRRVDLSGAVLHLLSLGETDVISFPWFDPPRPEAIRQALELLTLLGAKDDAGLTEIGKRMASLPVSPRLARLLIEGGNLGIPERVALAAALLSERDPFHRDRDAATPIASESDVLDRVEALEAYEKQGRTRFDLGELHRGAARGVLQSRDQLAAGLPVVGQLPVNRRLIGDELLRALFAAYPDRLAKRRTPGDSRAKMLGGRGLKLAPQSAVREPELFVAIDVEAGGTESWVRWASAVNRSWLPAEQVKTTIDVQFDDASGKLLAKKQTRYFDLVLDETPAHIGDEEAATNALVEAAKRNWAKACPDPESPAGLFLLRLQCLNEWRPDLELPKFDETSLQLLLPEVCRSLRSLESIRNGPWFDSIRNAFTYAQLQTLEREAPERLTMPTGNAIRLTYEPGRPPILAVRIQEIFGWKETPRIAGGKVKVLLHLLAPNYRPQAITDDLASFWANGYLQVRKELRSRYPKHSWPDDPLIADAIAGAKRRPIV